MFLYGVRSGKASGQASGSSHRSAALSVLGSLAKTKPLGQLTIVNELLHGEQHYFSTDDLLEELGLR